MKSKANSEKTFNATFDVTEELRDLNKNNDAGTNGDNKKKARTIFGTSYGDAKCSKQSGSGTRAQARAKPTSLLGK